MTPFCSCHSRCWCSFREQAETCWYWRLLPFTSPCYSRLLLIRIPLDQSGKASKPIDCQGHPYNTSCTQLWSKGSRETDLKTGLTLLQPFAFCSCLQESSPLVLQPLKLTFPSGRGQRRLSRDLQRSSNDKVSQQGGLSLVHCKSRDRKFWPQTRETHLQFHVWEQIVSQLLESRRLSLLCSNCKCLPASYESFLLQSFHMQSRRSYSRRGPAAAFPKSDL